MKKILVSLAAVALAVVILIVPASVANASMYWVSNNGTIPVKVTNLDNHTFTVAPGNGFWDMKSFVQPGTKCASVVRHEANIGNLFTNKTYYYPKASANKTISTPWNVWNYPIGVRIYSC